MNRLFLHCSHTCGDDIMIGIGSRGHKRKVTLMPEEALKLAYRLMSLARGGETQGFEELPIARSNRPDCPACGGTGRCGPYMPGGLSTICGNCK